MRLIDADALKFRDVKVTTNEIDIFGFGGYLVEECKGILQEEIWNAPTIDAEPVVRCANCKCWTEWSNGTGSCSRFALDWIGTDADDFCSFGERKDNE